MDEEPGGRITQLVDELTDEERYRLLSGSTDPDGTATGYLPPIDRLEIPALRMVDGPAGVRIPGEPATAFPAPIALAAAWNPSLARTQGAAIAREARAYGQDALLGPGLNLIRVPHCGRNFEYYSEDPYLTSRLGVATVEGIQSAGVIATAKHYVANNQETERYSIDVDVSERALRECYLPAFRAVVEEAGVGSVMTAYNRVNGSHMSEHRRLLTDVLRGEFGFGGYVVSDWYGTESADAAAAGLDLEMPGVGPEAFLSPEDREVDADIAGVVDAVDGLPTVPSEPWFGEPLRTAVADGRIDSETIDAKLHRILGTMERFGVLDGDRAGLRPASSRTESGDSETLRVSGSEEQSSVSSRASPDDITRTRSVLVSNQKSKISGDREALRASSNRPQAGDSEGELDTPAHRQLARRVATEGTVLLKNEGVLPLSADAELALCGPNADATKRGGGSSEVTPTTETSPLDGLENRDWSVTFERGIDPIPETSMFDLFGNEETDQPGDDPTTSIEAAVDATTAADCAVVVVQDDATEAKDRGDLRLPGDQDELVAAVAETARRTVVVVRTSGPVELPWIDAVDAVLVTWYPGQADGAALADVLSGDADPGGRLPVTFAKEEQYPTSAPERFPGDDGTVDYGDGVFVGYRHFDRESIEPLFPFGHGLSYARFEYGGATIDDQAGDSRRTATVRVPVENVSDRAGWEVVQTYLGADDPEAPRPEQELVGFDKLHLDPGERRTVSVPIEERSFARYDEQDGWTAPTGSYTLSVGRSSRDLRSRVSVTIG